MPNKLVVLLLLFTYFFLIPKVNAQSCSGNVLCCTSTFCSSGSQSCDPILDPGCTPCQVSCSTTESVNCALVGSACVDQCSDFAGGYLISGNCGSGGGGGGSQPTCPSGTIFCSGCNACMPNTQTCNAWEAASCGTGGGGGGGPSWGSCGSCSNCPPGPAAECVSAPDGSCVWDPGSCGGGGGAFCSVIWQNTASSGTGPITAYLGQTIDIQGFASGGLSHWEGSWRWQNVFGQAQPNLGTLTPFMDPTGSTYNTTFTATTPGTSQVNLYVSDPWDSGSFRCQQSRPVTVINCTPTCTLQCGQNNGCGGTCGSTDDGAPAAPTNLRADGVSPVTVAGTPTFQITPSTNQINFTWNAPAGALTDAYEIRITPQGGTECGANATCATSVGTNYTWNIPNAGISVWTIRIRSINSTCAAYGGADNGPWTVTHQIVLSGSVSGTFYLDQNNTCDPAQSVLVTPSTGSIQINGLSGYTSTLGPPLGSSNYTFSGVPYWTNTPNNVLTFTPGTSPSGVLYDCNCGTDTGATCVMSGIASPSSGNNFFLREQLNEAWWQVWGGNVYSAVSAGLGINSKVPPSTMCNAGSSCSPFILANDRNDIADSAGIAVTSGAEVDTTSAADGYNLSQLTDRGSAQLARGPVIRGTPTGRQDFAFFKSRFGLGVNPTNDTLDPVNFTKPTASPTNGGEAYYYQGDVTIRNAWSVASGEKITVFVDGNLTITDEAPDTPELITVAEGGYLAFIVSGNIVIDPSVGHATLTATTGNVEGIYIANGNITTSASGAGDKRFVGEGNFVGWSGVSFNRVMTGNDNNTKPADLVIYRPDFLRNLPDAMTRPNYTWQEIN